MNVFACSSLLLLKTCGVETVNPREFCCLAHSENEVGRQLRLKK